MFENQVDATPNDDFRKDLLSKPKDYKITDAIKLARNMKP
jgi:hypothetical protein